MNPLVIGAGGAALLLLLTSKSKASTPSAPSTPSVPGAQPPGSVVTPTGAGSVAERVANVLATQDPNAIRFEAGRLRQEGFTAQAAQLEAVAAQLEAQIAAGQRPPPVYVPPPVVTAPPVTTPPIVVPTAPPIVIVSPGLPPGTVTSPGVPQPPASTIPQPFQPWIDGVPPELQKVVLRKVAAPAPFDPKVLLLQARLLDLGYSVGSNGTDGKFGADTEKAVKAFQKANNLPQDGIAGALTIARMAQPSAKRGPGAPLVTVPTAPPPASTLPAPGPWIQGVPAELQGVLLVKVSPAPVDPRVTILQTRLAELGYLKPADIDGKFGPTTEKAVKAFQTNAKLKPIDGKVGPATLAALAGAGAVRMQGDEAFGFDPGFDRAPPEPIAGTPLPGVIPPMVPNSPEPRKALAARVALMLFGAPPGQENKTLIAAFQAQEGLKASGFYGPATAEALAENYGIIPPKPLYWSKKHQTKAKQAYRARLLAFVPDDPQRAEEWQQAAKGL